MFFFFLSCERNNLTQRLNTHDYILNTCFFFFFRKIVTWHIHITLLRGKKKKIPAMLEWRKEENLGLRWEMTFWKCKDSFVSFTYGDLVMRCHVHFIFSLVEKKNKFFFLFIHKEKNLTEPRIWKKEKEMMMSVDSCGKVQRAHHTHEICRTDPIVCVCVS